MKRGWILEPLAAIAHVAMGQSPPSTTYNMTGEGLPFLQGKFEFGEVYPTPVRFCSKPLRVAERDDILVSVRAPVGPVNLSPAKCCIGRGLAAVRGQPTRIDQLYLFYYLRSAQQEISALGQGSTFGAIGRRDVEGIEVPHPIDLREQRRVASILQRAHQLKAKRKDANLPAARLVQAVFLKMFGDPETNPKGWTTQPLGSVLREKLMHGKSLIRQKVRLEPPGTCVLKLSALTDNGFDPLQVKYYDDQSVDSRWILENEDILVSRSNTIELVGRTGRYEGRPYPCMFPDLMIRVRPNTGIVEPSYLEHYLRTRYVRNFFGSRARGTSGSMPKISNKDIEDVEVCIPPMEHQRKFLSSVRGIRALRDGQQLSSGEINELFNSLMHKAFKGELQLKTA